MNKVRLMLLSGCHVCHSLIEGLDAAGVSFESVDADDNCELADSIEAVLNTANYPIAIIDQPNHTTYVYRSDTMGTVGSIKLTNLVTKIGCATNEHMLDTIKTIIK